MRTSRPVRKRDHENDMSHMTDDPYLYDGSDVLANLFGARDASQLAEAERLAIAPRIDALCYVHPVFTTPAFLALHQAIFKPVYAWAGQARTVSLGLDGAEFAKPSVIMPSLNARFAKLNKAGGFADLPRAEFCESLAHHISELHAIMPFRSGNRRALAVHSAQLALAAGHNLETCIKDKSLWDEALRHSFLTCDHSRISDALLGTAQPQIDVSSPSGLPLLPARDATVHRRYTITLTKAGSLLGEHLAAATLEADALAVGVASGALNAARQELDFLRHPKGPLFQLGVLQTLGASKILAVIHDSQSPLETVREIAAAALIELSEYPQTAIAEASLALNRPAYPLGGSPHQDRLAVEFLANAPEDNLADPRFATVQRLVDKATSGASRASGGKAKHINAATKKARTDVAARIRRGDMFAGAAATTLAVPRHTKAA